MDFLSIWPYLLLIPSVAVGIMLGWQLQLARQKKSSTDNAIEPTNPMEGLIQTRIATLEEAQSELTRLEEEIRSIHQNIQEATEQHGNLEKDYSDLLIKLDGRRTAVEGAKAQLTARKDLKTSQKEQILAEVDASGAELEELQHLNDRYESRIIRLTQQVERQHSELQRLRQTVKIKTAEIEEQQELIQQREAELLQLIRQRQQREADLQRAQEQLNEVNKELRRLVEHQDRSEIFERMPPSGDILEHRRRKDVTPSSLPGLPAGNTSNDD